MNLKAHYKMGRWVHCEMAENGMPLKRWVFLFGNLAPDLCLSFIARPHLYTVTALFVKKRFARLYGHHSDPRSVAFSFWLGLLTHYICDAFCYAHSPSFQGGTRAHMHYERGQTVEADALRPFEKQNSVGVGLARLLNALDEAVRQHEAALAQNAGAASEMDIALAVDAAAWAASAAFLYAQAVSDSRMAGAALAESLTGDRVERYI